MVIAQSGCHDGSCLYSFGNTIQNNGFGIRALQSHLRIELTTITNSAPDGAQLLGQSTAGFATLVLVMRQRFQPRLPRQRGYDWGR
jgi:hypothetical protein